MRRVCRYCGHEFEGDPGANACPDCVAERSTQVVRPRVCQTCGVTFPGGPRAWYCPRCRAERQRQHNREARERKKAGTTRPIGSTAYCEICGNPYTVMGSLQRYCPGCAPEAVRQKANAGSRAWNAEHTTPEGRRAMRKAHVAEISCAVCGRMFAPTGPTTTCSPACADALARRSSAVWEANHRETRNAYHRQLHADKLAAMTDEERREYRDRINARARTNYKKRKEADKNDL